MTFTSNGATRKYTDRLYFDPQTIPAGSNSPAPDGGLDLGNHALNGVIVPAGMTGTLLSVLGSLDGKLYYPVQDMTGAALAAVITSAAALVWFDYTHTSCIKYVKFQSNATEVADRILTPIGIRISENTKY